MSIKKLSFVDNKSINAIALGGRCSWIGWWW